MSSFVLYNSMTKKKEVFSPKDPQNVKMYCCGPTVYDLLHVGNFRGAVLYHGLRNWLENQGFKINFVYNYTDVDDKIIQRAQKEGKDWKQISERFILEFEKDYQRLNLRKADHHPRVSEHMKDIENMVDILVKNQHAYEKNGDVFFSVQDFPSYGKLSNRSPEDLQSGVRVDIHEGKRNPLDFALWKSAKPTEPSWSSPWGPGRPGWHIECSAMCMAILGEEVDLHGGGIDLVFPHHENEIAQSEAASGKTFVRHWFHHNMIEFGGSKMSKSLGNVRTARSFMDEYGPEVLKMLLLSAHYRSVLDFSEVSIEGAIRNLARIYSALHRAQLVPQAGGVPDPEWEVYLAQRKGKISDYLNDDFNTPGCFSEIFEVVRKYNGFPAQDKKAFARAAGLVEIIVQFVGNILGVFTEPPTKFLQELDDHLLKQKSLQRSTVDALVNQRQDARVKKDFAKADQLRAELKALGIAVQDTPTGSWWEVEK